MVVDCMYCMNRDNFPLSLPKREMRKKVFDPFDSYHRARFLIETLNCIEMENVSPSTCRAKYHSCINWYLSYAIGKLFRVSRGRDRRRKARSRAMSEWNMNMKINVIKYKFCCLLLYYCRVSNFTLSQVCAWVRHQHSYLF